MEKTMSVEEKIRRAEEIYNRRNGLRYDVSYQRNKKKKGPSFTHRMVKQIVICFMIYGVFYIVNNREYFLSPEFRENVQVIAAKNEILNNLYNSTMKYVEEYLIKQEDINTIEENTTNSNHTEESITDNNESNIGGSNEEIEAQEKEISQEEKDVEDIKNATSFILPVEGKISSTFGWRTPTTSTVPKYHTGIDIATTSGTVIKSATDGIVTLVSTQGDYGNHYKISKGDITIIYAHCSKLYLNEGDTVYQGEEIAEVGSTGNSTRTTFAF